MPEVGDKIKFRLIGHSDVEGEGIVTEEYGSSYEVLITDFPVRRSFEGGHQRVLDREVLEVVCEDCPSDEVVENESEEDATD